MLTFFFQICVDWFGIMHRLNRKVLIALTTLSSCVRIRCTNVSLLKTRTKFKISKRSEACQILGNEPLWISCKTAGSFSSLAFVYLSLS